VKKKKELFSGGRQYNEFYRDKTYYIIFFIDTTY